MRIETAKYIGGELILNADSLEARKFVYHFQPGEYEIKKTHKKRSLDANAKAWALIGEISAAMRIPKETIYAAAIADVGAFETLTISKNAFDDFQRIWSARGLGWVVQIVGEVNESFIVNAHYGSSVYDTKQMSSFIDYLIQDCEALGLETISAREKSLLLEGWDEKINKSGSNIERT